MANKHLATYLNDHLAGATIGVELLSSLEAVHPDTERARVFAELRAEVEEDRQALKALMDRLNITESAPRKVTGWLAAQLTHGGAARVLVHNVIAPNFGDLQVRLDEMEATARTGKVAAI